MWEGSGGGHVYLSFCNYNKKFERKANEISWPHPMPYGKEQQREQMRHEFTANPLQSFENIPNMVIKNLINTITGG